MYHPTLSLDNVRLFTMVSIMSSSLMMNVPGNINYNQLREMQFFLKYASSGLELGSVKANQLKLFQSLTFLVRDFMLDDTFGWTGGQQVVNNFLETKPNTPKEIKEMVDTLNNSFSTINGFTLPFPGSKVVIKSFDGRLRNID